jgi:putative heme-binding domain-containing protein
MKIVFSIGCSWLFLALLATGQDASGIKSANIKGADLKLMKEHDPEVERANFELLPGYEVNLFASEPMLANPIHMVWDSRGRLWVACSWAYPQLQPGEVANDKIIILEDTDGDGAADKSTVFAEGLYMPTGIELANGGCYVAQTPDVFFLKDTDGDDVADVRELALTGFGIEDSHHSISAWRRGPGGWLYFQEGIFLHSQIETQHGMVRNYNGGVYQYNPRTQKLRMFARIGVGNPWGHVFDRWGQSFFIDNPRVSYLSPSTGNSGEKVALKGLLSTEKQCGGDLASGTHLPASIRGQLLTCRFKSRTIIRYEFHQEGAGFSANVLPPLISSRHPNFRPVDCKIGPDGAIYVADWYNSIINHAQHDFRDPRRDHDHGRIWRITAKDRPLVNKPKLAGAALAELVDHLQSPNAWTRHQARLELSERDRDAVVEALEGWAAKLDPLDPGHDHHLVEAMWACQNVEGVSEEILKRVLAARDGHARAAGARMIRYWHAKLSDPVALIAKGAADSFPRTRMEAILSAGYVPKAEAFPAALQALDHPRDQFIEVAIPQTMAALEPLWRPALEAGSLRFAKSEHREFALRGAGINFEKRMTAFLKKEESSPEEAQAMAEQFIELGQERHVRMVAVRLKRGLNPGPASSLKTLVEALMEIGRRGKVEGARHIAPLKRQALMEGADPMWIRLMAAWKIQTATDEMWNKQHGAPVRIWTPAAVAWARAAGEIGGEKNLEELRRLAGGGESFERRSLGVLGLAVADLEAAAPHAADLFSSELPSVSAGELPLVILQEFLGRTKGSACLGAALMGKDVHPSIKLRGTEFHRRTGLVPSKLLKHFELNAKTLSRDLSKETRRSLVADVANLGDPARGEIIYRRKQLACMSCHGIGAVGPAIGPNLAAVGAAATTDYVVEAILEPDKSIAEHYENMMVTLKGGGLQMGVITYRSKKEIVLRDSAMAGREIRIPRDTIRKIKPMPSLMPARLVDQLTSREEFLDLASFVSQLGRPGPYANDESPVLRKWRRSHRIEGGIGPELELYSLVNGGLPMRDLFFAEEHGKQIARVHSSVRVQANGNVSLKINDAKGITVSYIAEGEPDETVGNWTLIEDLTVPFKVQKGRYLFQFVVVRGERGDTDLRVELASAPRSDARVQPVYGK